MLTCLQNSFIIHATSRGQPKAAVLIPYQPFYQSAIILLVGDLTFCAVTSVRLAQTCEALGELHRQILGCACQNQLEVSDRLARILQDNATQKF